MLEKVRIINRSFLIIASILLAVFVFSFTVRQAQATAGINQ